MGGQNFTCSKCHMVIEHKISGKSHGAKATLMDWEALGYPGDPKNIDGKDKLGLLKQLGI